MLTITVFAVFVQLAYSCCGPAQWEGYEGVSVGLKVNGTGEEGTVSIFYFILHEAMIAFKVNLKVIKYIYTKQNMINRTMSVKVYQY